MSSYRWRWVVQELDRVHGARGSAGAARMLQLQSVSCVCVRKRCQLHRGHMSRQACMQMISLLHS